LNITPILVSIQNFSKTLTSIALAICTLLGSGWIVKSMLSHQSVVIEKIEIPPSLEQKGLTGEVIVQRILDELAHLRSMAQVDRDENAVFSSLSSTNNTKIEASFGGVSLKSIEQGMSFLFHKQIKRISGEIVSSAPRSDASISYEERLRVDNFVISKRSMVLADEDLDKLIQNMAFDLYAHFEPFRAAVAAWKIGKLDLARDLLRSQITNGSIEDQKYALWLRSKLTGSRQEQSDLLEALNLDPKFHLALVSLSDFYRRSKDYNQGITYADRAIEVNPNSPLGYHAKGRNFREAGKLEEALEIFIKTCSLPTPYAPCHNQIGEIILITDTGAGKNSDKKHKDAYTSFIKATKIDPKHPWAHSNAAYAAIAMGDINEGLVLANRAILLDEKTIAHRVRYAWALHKKGQKKEAFEIISAVTSEFPNWQTSPPSGWGNRSIISLVMNDNKQ
jgi:tetratricopeptide (TPR) repeat protein